MPKMDLSKYGIKNVKEVLYNPTYEVLYNEETKPELTGYDKGQVTELGAINVMTGVYTGRSPKDKFIVYDQTTKEGAPGEVWWTTPEYPNDNHKASVKTWNACKKLAQKEPLRQEAFRSRWILRNSQRHPHEGSLHHGSRMAGSLRDQHVHPS